MNRERKQAGYSGIILRIQYFEAVVSGKMLMLYKSSISLPGKELQGF